MHRLLHTSVAAVATFLCAGARAHAQTANPLPEPTVLQVPATNEWGMFIMVLLMLTASTAALYGGGWIQRVLGERFAGHLEPRKPARPRQPKNRTRRRKFQKPQRTRAVSHSRPLQRRISSSQSKKRHDGPGIRG